MDIPSYIVAATISVCGEAQNIALSLAEGKESNVSMERKDMIRLVVFPNSLIKRVL
jgi:hypothetical protein